MVTIQAQLSKSEELQQTEQTSMGEYYEPHHPQDSHRNRGGINVGRYGRNFRKCRRLEYDATFNKPKGITTDGTNLYLTDYTNHTIRKIVIVTAEVTTLAGSGDKGYVNATGTNAKFSGPSGVTTDGTNIYVTDSVIHQVRKIQ